ncbi:amidohydrolase [Prochlorococcus marinus]|uniref:Hydrolase n=1 Tax=Prochlorococcus marinus XMU1408 TaxID=2213228 RepID=A0A318RC34_PROMR|nr:amidohydrolase [Prochlorococcus marinus]MBW3042839.1 hydrolase [Prochlorococcus marinus str. XMU1408]PYE00666.1 hydrolase [Prochlorococcus marinus XMU1408]
MKDLGEKIHVSSKEILPDLIELRRHLHAHPELSGQEYQTAALVAGELRKSGWEVKEAVGRTGVVAEMGQKNRPVVALRVDMDALPIEERTGLDYTSSIQGLMHACGHDLHTCIGLGVAKVLANKKFTNSRIRIIFQPAEEIAKGANWMRAEKVLEDVKALFGVHVYPDLSVGKIGIKSGTFTAAAAELEIDIIGQGGHGARPHEGVDSIWVAAKVISGIQEAISRRLDALKPVVISFGKISGGNAFNVIAERVKLLGTVRCLDSNLYEQLPQWIEKIVKNIASNYGAEVHMNFKSIAPPVYNDPELTNLLSSCAKTFIDEENIVYLENPSLGAEDFAFYLQDVPGTMFRLGVAGEKGCAPLHSSYFSLDERSLELGIKILSQAIIMSTESS